MKKIAVLPGDGIGTEIIAQAVAVLEAMNLPLTFEYAPVGGAAYDIAGHFAARDFEAGIRG